MPTRGTLFVGLALTVCVLWAQSVSPRAEGAAPHGTTPLPKHPHLVTLNVVAFDGHGQPVADLTEDDFQIQDQGKRQQIAFFRHNETKPKPAGPAESHEYSNRSGATVQQATVILLDLLNANLSDRGTGYEGIDHTLEPMEASDNLFLYLLTAEGKLFPVHGLPGGAAAAPPGHPPGQLWTQQVRPLLDQAVRTVNRLKPVDALDPTIRVRETFDALGSLASQLAAIPGRKNIVWVTHGVPIVFRTLTNEMVDMTEQVKRFSGTLNRFGVAVYSVDQGGPGANAPGAGGREGPGYQSQDTLQMLADLTGGHAYPGNNVESAVPAAMAAARGSYLILYEPPAQNWDNKFHKIKVNCSRKGIRIQTQQGYFANPGDGGDNQIRAAFEAAATNPIDSAGIGLTATVSPVPGEARTFHYQLRVNAADLLLSHQGDHENGQLAVGFYGINGGKVEPAAPGLLNVSLTKEQYATAMKEGIPVSHDKAVAEGVQGVRIVVVDLSSAEAGALTIPVGAAVPDK